jgi:hypothetical protein
LGKPDQYLTLLFVARANWELVHSKHVAARAAAIAARQAKDEGRAGYDKLIREVVRQIQSNAKTSDAQRGALGITIADAVATPVGAPPTRPLVEVDFSKRLLHRIAFADERTPTQRTKPKGVMGAEVGRTKVSGWNGIKIRDSFAREPLF